MLFDTSHNVVILLFDVNIKSDEICELRYIVLNIPSFVVLLLKSNSQTIN